MNEPADLPLDETALQAAIDKVVEVNEGTPGEIADILEDTSLEAFAIREAISTYMRALDAAEASDRKGREVQALRAELSIAREALEELVRLKHHPDHDRLTAEKQAAWDRAYEIVTRLQAKAQGDDEPIAEQMEKWDP